MLLIYAIYKDGYSQSNHSQITRSKNFYSLIQPLPLPCTCHQFYALALQPPPPPSPTHHHPFKFTVPLSRIHIWNQVGSLWWSFFGRNSQSVKSIGCFSRGAPWLMSDGILSVILWDSVWGGFHHWGYIRESWTPPVPWFYWFTPKTKTIGWTS